MQLMMPLSITIRTELMNGYVAKIADTIYNFQIASHGKYFDYIIVLKTYD